jgi:hypothetical protein
VISAVDFSIRCLDLHIEIPGAVTAMSYQDFDRMIRRFKRGPQRLRCYRIIWSADGYQSKMFGGQAHVADVRTLVIIRLASTPLMIRRDRRGRGAP